MIAPKEALSIADTIHQREDFDGSIVPIAEPKKLTIDR